MLIQCPSCQFETEIPDSKQGAKLRCPECSRVFVARAPGARRGSSGSSSSSYVILGVVVVAALGLYLKFGRGQGRDVTAAPQVPAETGPAETVEAPEGTGWDAAPVVFVRELHELALAQDEGQLLLALDGERAWTASRADEGAWQAQSPTVQTEFVAALVAELTHGESSEMARDWEPFDGWVEERDGDDRLVRVRVAHRDDESLANRHVEWNVAQVKGRWKAWGWRRWVSPEEQQALDREARQAAEDAEPKIVRKTLTDGSKVIEGEVRAIPYADDTPEELRAEIDALVARVVDLEADDPRDWMDAREELVSIGKPTIPALLTFISETPHTTIDAGGQLMRVNLTLQDITGYITSFKPHETLGASEERQESGIKQWFGWYDRKFKKFTAAEEAPDPFADEEE